jgi:hypothetical protein
MMANFMGRSLLIIMMLAWITAPVMAQQQQWWFDVEIIIFKRDRLGQDLTEAFEQAAHIDTTDAFDLIHDYLYPKVNQLRDTLPYCSEPEDDSNGSIDLNTILNITRAIERERIEEFEALFGFSPSNQDLDETKETEITDFTYLLDDPLKQFDLIQWQQPTNYPCVFASEHQVFAVPFDKKWQVTPYTDHIPDSFNPSSGEFNGQNQILPKSALRLNSLRRNIERRNDLSIMSHYAWRQQVVFGQTKAQSMHLYAGENFQKTFTSDGYSKLTESPIYEDQQTSKSSLIEDVERILFSDVAMPAHNNTALEAKREIEHDSELWELDGLFKIYLRLLGQTPYLHIDSDLVFRQQDVKIVDGVQIPYLYSYQFDQLRRIISKQIHYFDHPLFGIVVQLNRYHPPAAR